MKNYPGYIIVTKEGKIFDPEFVIGDLRECNLLTKEEAYAKDLEHFIRLVFLTKEDAEMTMDWYLLSCEYQGLSPEKLSAQKVQVTFVWREV